MTEQFRPELFDDSEDCMNIVMNTNKLNKDIDKMMDINNEKR
jgi:hypothetical protein